MTYEQDEYICDGVLAIKCMVSVNILQLELSWLIMKAYNMFLNPWSLSKRHYELFVPSFIEEEESKELTMDVAHIPEVLN